MQLIVATRNGHKTREIQQILGSDFAVSDLSAHPEIPATPEHGKSFEENALYFHGIIDVIRSIEKDISRVSRSYHDVCYYIEK